MSNVPVKCPICDIEMMTPTSLARHFYWHHCPTEDDDFHYPYSMTVSTWDDAVSYINRLLLGVNPDATGN